VISAESIEGTLGDYLDDEAFVRVVAMAITSHFSPYPEELVFSASEEALLIADDILARVSSLQLRCCSGKSKNGPEK
jgi:hypothetical protein